MEVGARKRIGATALEVGAVGLGTAGLAGLYNDVASTDADAAVAAAWTAGIRYFDTAPYYGYGKSEHRLGNGLRAVQERFGEDDWVISSKVGRLLKSRMRAGAQPRDMGDGWASPYSFEPVYDYSYDGVMRSYEDSLQRLGLAKIDILLVHDIGRITHGAEHMSYWRQLDAGGGFKALAELRSAGAISAVGLGVNEVAVVHDAINEFDLDCCLLAGRYTLLEQAALDELFPSCVCRQVSLLLGGVFNSGILATGVHALGGARVPTYNYAAAQPHVIERVRQIECNLPSIRCDAGIFGTKVSVRTSTGGVHRHGGAQRDRSATECRWLCPSYRSVSLAVAARGGLATSCGSSAWSIGRRTSTHTSIFGLSSAKTTVGSPHRYRSCIATTCLWILNRFFAQRKLVQL